MSTAGLKRKGNSKRGALNQCCSQMKPHIREIFNEFFNEHRKKNLKKFAKNRRIGIYNAQSFARKLRLTYMRYKKLTSRCRSDFSSNVC